MLRKTIFLCLSLTLTIQLSAQIAEVIITVGGCGSNKPTITDISHEHADCNNSGGSIEITGAAGGSGPYEYRLNLPQYTWQSENTFNNLPSGTYTTFIRDSADASCQNDGPIAIIRGGPISVWRTGGIHATCGRDNGSIYLQASGGLGSHEFSINGTSWSSTGNFTRLFAGTYQTWVRNSDNSCLTQGPIIEVPAVYDPPSLEVTFVGHTSCGLQNGKITLSGSEGTGNYLFRLNDGPWQQSPTFVNLSEGTYIPYIKNDVQGNGACIQSLDAIEIIGTEALAIQDPQIKHTECGLNNGYIKLSGSGGVSNYEYRLNDGPWKSSGDFTNLAPGIYTPKIRNKNNDDCLFEGASISINASQSINVTLNSKTDPTECQGSDGSITVQGTPLGGNYEYRLTNNTTYRTWQSSTVFSNLPQGSYKLWIKNEENPSCTTEGPTILLDDPTNLDVVVNKSDPSCHQSDDGSISLTISGSIGASTTTWTGPEEIGNNNNPTNLMAGAYEFTVKDESNCIVSSEVKLQNPEKLTLNLRAIDETSLGAADGAVDATVSGGTSPYSYQWSNSAQTEDVQNLLGLETYGVTVTDANGCTTTESVFVNGYCAGPDCIRPILSVIRDTICHGETYDFYGETIQESGIYLHEYMHEEQIILLQLHLIVREEAVVNITKQIIATDPFHVAGQALAQSGQYEFHLTSIHGCDSTINVDLEVVEAVTTAIPCESQIVLQPGPAEGKDITVTIGSNTTSIDDELNISVEKENPFCRRNCPEITKVVLIDFPEFREDLREVLLTYPLSRAELKLTSILSQSQTINMYPITTDWSMQSVNGNNLPNYNVSDKISFAAPQHTPSFEREFTVDVTNIILDALEGNDFYGFFLEIDIRNPTRKQDLVSSRGSNSMYRPALILNVGSQKNTLVSRDLCPGESIEIGGQQINEAGQYFEYLTADNGCDSTVTHIVTQTKEVNYIYGCEGDEVTVGDQVFNEPGNYQVTLYDDEGYCDQTFNITIGQPKETDLRGVIADGDVYYFGSDQLNQSGQYQQILSTSEGCDSVVNLDLIKLPPLQNPTQCDESLEIIPTGGQMVDAYIRTDNPDNNYGNSSASFCISRPTLNSKALFYTPHLSTLDLGGKSVEKCWLWFRVYNISGTQKLIAKAITDNWSETSVSWNNQPGLDSETGIEIPVNGIGWYQVDITPFYLKQRSGEIFGISLEIGDDISSNAYAYIYTSDNQYVTNRPKYTLNLQAPVPSPTEIIDTVLCLGSSVTVLGQEYTAPGVYFQSYMDNGCETFRIINVEDSPMLLEYDKLAEIYFQTNGHNWTNNSGWLEDCNVCHWYGITCDEGNNITKIDLSNNNLTGGLSSEMFSISTIEEIDFSNNLLDGELPEGVLITASHVNLNSNNLKGDFPPDLQDLCDRLDDIEVYDNDYLCPLVEYCHKSCITCITIGREIEGADCYAWLKDGEVLESETGPLLEVCTNEPGLYTQIASNNGNVIYEDETRIGEECDGLSVSISQNKNAFCVDGERITLSAEGDFSSYTWESDIRIWPPDGLHTKSIFAVREGTYRLTVKDEQGCSATASTTIMRGDPVTLDFEGYNPTLCPGAEIDIKATSNGQSITWKDNDGKILSEGEHLYISSLPYAAHRINVTASNDICAYTESLPFGKGPDGSLVANGGNCSDEPFILSASSTDPSATYTWNTYESGSEITVYGNGNYWVRLTGANGCVTQLNYDLLRPERPESELVIDNTIPICPTLTVIPKTSSNSIVVCESDCPKETIVSVVNPDQSLTYVWHPTSTGAQKVISLPSLYSITAQRTISTENGPLTCTGNQLDFEIPYCEDCDFSCKRTFYKDGKVFDSYTSFQNYLENSNQDCLIRTLYVQEAADNSCETYYSQSSIDQLTSMLLQHATAPTNQAMLVLDFQIDDERIQHVMSPICDLAPVVNTNTRDLITVDLNISPNNDFYLTANFNFQSCTESIPVFSQGGVFSFSNVDNALAALAVHISNVENNCPANTELTFCGSDCIPYSGTMPDASQLEASMQDFLSIDNLTLKVVVSSTQQQGDVPPETSFSVKESEYNNATEDIVLWLHHDPSSNMLCLKHRFNENLIAKNSKFTEDLRDLIAISDERVSSFIQSGDYDEAFSLDPALRMVQKTTAVKSWSKSIIEDAALPEYIWNYHTFPTEYTKSFLTIEGFLCGNVDGVFEEASGAIQLLQLGLDFIIDAQTRSQIFSSLGSITWSSIADFGQKLFEEKVELYQSPTPIPNHTAGKDVAAIVLIVVDPLGGIGKKVVTKHGNLIQEIVGEIGQDLRNELLDLETESLKKLLKELNERPYLRDAMNAPNGERLVKAWDALFDYPVFRKNIDYLENTDDYLTRTGKTKQNLIDDLEAYEGPKETFLDELYDTPASGTYANNPSGVWNENPFLRGREIEDVLGQNLHDNFPFIDKFDDVANSVTSIKSTDTYAKTYQSLDNLDALWKKYVDDLVAMPPPNVGVTFDGITVSGYNKQILEIAIPDPLVGGQVDVLTSVTNYAKGKGVGGSDIEIIIQVIE